MVGFCPDRVKCRIRSNVRPSSHRLCRQSSQQNSKRNHTHHIILNPHAGRRLSASRRVIDREKNLLLAGEKKIENERLDMVELPHIPGTGGLGGPPKTPIVPVGGGGGGQEPPSEPWWTCVGCGTMNPPVFKHCWDCAGTQKASAGRQRTKPEH
eukprot:g38741.t1